MTRLLLEIGGALALCFAIGGWWVEHNRHEVGIGIAECQAKVDAAVKKETDAQVLQRSEYQQQLEQINAQHQAELAAISTRVISTPVRLCHAGAIRGNGVPGTVAPASPQPAGAGGAVDGAGDYNIRPAIEQFKAKIETIVADCRAAIASWPVQ